MKVLKALAADLQARLPKNYTAQVKNNGQEFLPIETPHKTEPIAVITCQAAHLEATMRPGPITCARFVDGYKFRGHGIPSDSYRGVYRLENPRSLYRLDADLIRFGLPLKQYEEAK